MNMFFISFLVLPVLAFITLLLLTDSLVYAIIALLITDLVFTILFIKNKKQMKT
ncbi:hypothetical protein [Salinicoccus carnicancri]|uniref:hypothetical protein n=1 Tax=Salinicoccus carnicancri TaxID=558170 RepID=UPI000313E942|nr:hypothetical protein [Salinicoccus carnicancri]